MNNIEVMEKRTLTNYTIEEQNEIGLRIALIFKLKRDREHADRWQTTWGTKTNIGILNTFQRINEEIAKGEFVS